MELSSLGRLTHSRHFDSMKHGDDGLLVPAGLILALATSLSARDMHEVCLREAMVEARCLSCSELAVNHAGWPTTDAAMRSYEGYGLAVTVRVAFGVECEGPRYYWASGG